MTDTGLTVPRAEVLEAPVVEPTLDGDHERFTHIVLEGFKPEDTVVVVPFFTTLCDIVPLLARKLASPP